MLIHCLKGISEKYLFSSWIADNLWCCFAIFVFKYPFWHYFCVCVSIGTCNFRQWQSFWSSHSPEWTDPVSRPRQQFLCLSWSCTWCCGMWTKTYNWQDFSHYCRGILKSAKAINYKWSCCWLMFYFSHIAHCLCINLQGEVVFPRRE